MTSIPHQGKQATEQASLEDAGLSASGGLSVPSSDRPAPPHAGEPSAKRTTVREAILAFRQLGVPAYTRVDETESALQDESEPDEYLADDPPQVIARTIEELVDERMNEPFEYGDLVDQLMMQPQNQGKPRREMERTVMLHMVCSGG